MLGRQAASLELHDREQVQEEIYGVRERLRVSSCRLSGLEHFACQSRLQVGNPERRVCPRAGNPERCVHLQAGNPERRVTLSSASICRRVTLSGHQEGS